MWNFDESVCHLLPRSSLRHSVVELYGVMWFRAKSLVRCVLRIESRCCYVILVLLVIIFCSTASCVFPTALVFEANTFWSNYLTATGQGSIQGDGEFVLCQSDQWIACTCFSVPRTAPTTPTQTMCDEERLSRSAKRFAYVSEATRNTTTVTSTKS